MMSNASPITWRKSYAPSDGHHVGSPPAHMSPSLYASAAPIGIKKRRQSSFNSLYSPFTRRRSFLSKNMIENESVQCYKLSAFSSHGGATNENIPSFSISLSESQGFLWNQDLFASSYQQSEAGVHNMMSMSDGSYYLGGNGRSWDNENSQDDNSNSPLVDVIDVVVGNDDYNSDVDIVTEVVKVGNYGEDDDDDDDEEEDDDDDENEPEYYNTGISNDNTNDDTTNAGVHTKLNTNRVRELGSESARDDEIDSIGDGENDSDYEEDIFVSDL